MSVVLDDFIRAVGGPDEAYVAQWPRAEWQAAFAVYNAFSGGPEQYTLAPSAGMPEWLRGLVEGRATPATDVPAPTLCTLWTETLDWFDVAAEHPDDLVLEVSRPVDGQQVTSSQLRAAWTAVREANGVPVTAVHLVPHIQGEDPRVMVTIEAFYAIDPAGSAAASAAEAAFGWAGGEPYWFHDPLEVVRGAGLTAGHVTAWEWLS